MFETLSNEVMVCLLDEADARHDTLPTGLADTLLAALTAEPETLAELETAVTRYNQAIVHTGLLSQLESGMNETPWDAGLLIIDLPARLIVAATEPTLYEPKPLGFVLYCPDPPLDWALVNEDDVCWVRYRLSEHWLITNDLSGWRELAAQRRQARAANPPFDARPGLFDPLPDFIARACLAARDAGHTDPLIELHERWLLTPQPVLRDQTPREILLAQREFIEYDMDSRATQWSFIGACPNGLNPASVAYRCSGFGTNSNVIYFDLVRYLLAQGWTLISQAPSIQVHQAVEHLTRLQNEWLTEGGDYNRSPAWILEQERRRLPITVKAGEFDFGVEETEDEKDDLPSLPGATGFGPCFWNLDGSGMDMEDNWIFSFHHTQAAWEAERHEWAEMSRKFNEEYAQRQADIAWADGVTIHDDRQAPTDQNEEDDFIPF